MFGHWIDRNYNNKDQRFWNTAYQKKWRVKFSKNLSSIQSSLIFENAISVIWGSLPLYENEPSLKENFSKRTRLPRVWIIACSPESVIWGQLDKKLTIFKMSFLYKSNPKLISFNETNVLMESQIAKSVESVSWWHLEVNFRFTKWFFIYDPTRRESFSKELRVLQSWLIFLNAVSVIWEQLK